MSCDERAASRSIHDLLIVGSGGREHALAWKLRQSPGVNRLYVAPGNAGTAASRFQASATIENVPIAATDIPGIARFVEENNIGLTVVGPEAPLAMGLADELRARGRRVVGPNAAAARIESSKSFAKEVMARAGVQTAAHAVFTDLDAALRHLDTVPYPVVIKADGLAAGKGVVICRDRPGAEAAVRSLMPAGRSQTAAPATTDGPAQSGQFQTIVIEEYLTGPEVSLLALIDGERAVALPLAQDHKRLGDGDTGPNTGGMGAYAPVPFVDHEEVRRLMRLTVDPVVAALAEAGTPYRGVLFAGLMLTPDGPKVLEYNCRFGDPEAQVVIPLIEGDLLPWLEAVADGELPGQVVSNSGLASQVQTEVPVRDGAAVGVVLAAPGYPDHPHTGQRIEGCPQGVALQPDVLVFHAGTALDAEGRLVTSGGRVLTVVGMGATIDEAAERAYAAPIRFRGMQRRGDIARTPHPPHPPAPSPSRGEGERVNESEISPLYGQDHRHNQHRTYFTEFPPHPLRGLGVRGRIAVLASGDGSNLQALMDACSRGDLDAEVVAVVSHSPEARALERARAAGVPAHAVPLTDRRDPEERRRMEEQVLDVLRAYEPDVVVLAGWMLILSGEFLTLCACPVLNVHPALLPLSGGPLDTLDPDQERLTGLEKLPVLRGAHAVRDAVSLRLPCTGVSVHRVTADVDAGPVIARQAVTIEETDDEASLYRRIKAVEHRLVIKAVETVLHSVPAGGVYA